MKESIEKRLETLISKQFAEGLNDNEAKELNALLQSSEEARSVYLAQCQLHSSLLEERDLLESLASEELADNVVPIFQEKHAPEVRSRHLKLFFGIGTAVAACGVALFVLLRAPNEQSFAATDPLFAPEHATTGSKSDGILEKYERTVAALPTTGSLSRPAATTVANKDDTIRFNRDIRPILSDNCFHCHGPDKNTREADLRLDTHEGILAELSDGRRTIIPGDPENSEFYKRIITSDQDMVMPPINSHKHLKEEDIKLFRDWIAQGAEWEDHWSFNDIVRPAVPEVVSSEKVLNSIDNFILRKLEQEGLTANEEADRHTLVRRVSFDTRGLPPTEEEIKLFVEDESPDAYEDMVDRFLADEKFGEHRARYWLDAARYSDTHGYHIDNYRSIWPYRDWVVEAFNDNMPFDQFTIEQIAGDMLPAATQSQQVATGFNRCNPTTSEGGAIDDEYYAIYAQDRVEATSTVWLGLTMGCASCHDHKFDPLSQKEFYQMAAFFRNTTQKAMDKNVKDTPPTIRVYSDEDIVKRPVLKATVASANQELLSLIGSYASVYPEQRDSAEWVARDRIDLQLANEEAGVVITNASHNEYQDEGALKLGEEFSFSFWVKAPELDSIQEPLVLFGRYDPETESRGWHIRVEKDLGVTLAFNTDTPKWRKAHDVKLTGESKLQPGTWNHVAITYDGKVSSGRRIVDYTNVFKMRVNNVETSILGLDEEFKLRGNIKTKKAFVLGTATPSEVAEGGVATIKDLRVFKTVLSTPEQELLALAQPNKHIQPSKPLKDVEADVAFDLEPIKKLIDDSRKATEELKSIERNSPITLVMKEKDDSEPFAHILARGDYASPAERVTAGVPVAVFDALPEGSQANRLALAYWLVDPQNPLPARVTVNRFWQELFGTGIVKTSEDFGSQGEPPSHLELLDWLAAEFIESEWDMKHMYKLMLMSSTYRQSTTISPEELEVDPENRLLARGPRFRLDAEMIRDQALFVSDLLVEQIGGEPVKPYQPAGVWKAVAYSSSNTSVFKADKGDKLYRRSLYTFWKRTAAPPSMAIFDAPTRESCSVRRERTNTPLQALVLMNDPQFVEAARHLAVYIIKEDSEDKFAAIYTRAMGVEPSEQVVQILKNTYDQILPKYIENPEAAQELISVGDSPVDESIDPIELATWTVVANQVMNLDSFISKN